MHKVSCQSCFLLYWHKEFSLVSTKFSCFTTNIYVLSPAYSSARYALLFFTWWVEGVCLAFGCHPFTRCFIKRNPFCFFYNSVEWWSVCVKVFTRCSWRNTNSNHFNIMWPLVKYSLLVVM